MFVMLGKHNILSSCNCLVSTWSLLYLQSIETKKISAQEVTQTETLDNFYLICRCKFVLQL